MANFIRGVFNRGSHQQPAAAPTPTIHSLQQEVDKTVSRYSTLLFNHFRNLTERPSSSTPLDSASLNPEVNKLLNHISFKTLQNLQNNPNFQTSLSEVDLYNEITRLELDAVFDLHEKLRSEHADNVYKAYLNKLPD